MIERKLLSGLLLSLCLITTGLAQPTPPDDLQLEDLRQWLRSNWYSPYYAKETNDRFKDKFYSDPYRDARREMYNHIDNENNEVEGVYSGFKRNWTFGGTGSNPDPINAEHTIPQSFFRPSGQSTAREPMRSDLHHLFPTFNSWNSTRGNHPFDDIPDNETTKWMILNSDQSSIPSSNKDGYSEFSNSNGYSRFEPREEHKGNVARAIFYFYTMYENNPNVQEPIASVGNIELLQMWHTQDPVDDAERARNDKVANYQGNRNPYISHPEIALRAWTGESVVSSTPLDNSNTISIIPNPAQSTVTISGLSERKARIVMYDLQGRIVLTTSSENSLKATLNVNSLESGAYAICIHETRTITTRRFVKL